MLGRIIRWDGGQGGTPRLYTKRLSICLRGQFWTKVWVRFGFRTPGATLGILRPTAAGRRRLSFGGVECIAGGFLGKSGYFEHFKEAEI